MAKTAIKQTGRRFPMLQGMLPVDSSQAPSDIIAGITLAALAIPEVMGYTKISGTSVITRDIQMASAPVMFGSYRDRGRHRTLT